LWKDLLKDLLEFGLDSYEKLGDSGFMESLFVKLSEKGYKITDIKKSDSGDYSFTITSESISFLRTSIDSDLWKTPEIKKIIKSYRSLKNIVPNDIVLKYKENKEIFQDMELFLDAVKEYAQKGLTKQRYKGLGEMNPEQLWKTTMDPQNRTLLQVSVLDADEAENLFTTLMGEKIEPRKDFIYNHALEVKELDI
jgi:DNA gyrase subunit B